MHKQLVGYSMAEHSEMLHSWIAGIYCQQDPKQIVSIKVSYATHGKTT